MKKIALALSLALSSTLALAGPPAPKAAGIESKDYQWAKMEGELKEALAKKGDVKRGQDTYEICGACHLPTGAGRSDGTFPQLAGQHSTVLIKQMADIRMGLRDNPTMYPFAKEMTDPQDLADTSAYINSLCIPVDHGKYEGADAAKQIAAMRPKFLTRDEVPADVVAKEREVAEATSREEGKPEAAIAKITEGRLNGFFKDVVLLEQPSVTESKRSVQAVLDEAGTTVKRFARFEVGA